MTAYAEAEVCDIFLLCSLLFFLCFLVGMTVRKTGLVTVWGSLDKWCALWGTRMEMGKDGG